VVRSSARTHLAKWGQNGSVAGLLVADAFANLDRFKTFSFGNLTRVVPSLLHMTAMKLAVV